MDMFWLIPAVIVGVPLLAALIALIVYSNRSAPPPNPPNVLVHKPSDGKPFDVATDHRDWHRLPVASLLDWRKESDEKTAR